jgi:hypothetical protein
VLSACTVTDWASLLPAIKAELECFPARAFWGRVSPGCERVPSIARVGNLLEAVNLALDGCCLRHIDRDAHRIGYHFVFVSAGTATFDATSVLAKVTKRRMNDLGASCDLIIVSSRPMHQAPLLVLTTPTGLSLPHLTLPCCSCLCTCARAISECCPETQTHTHLHTHAPYACACPCVMLVGLFAQARRSHHLPLSTRPHSG